MVTVDTGLIRPSRINSRSVHGSLGEVNLIVMITGRPVDEPA
ncbi:hypothetical protein ACH47Z_06465 [Streptomyces sp. NPDC020192]